MFNNYGHLCMDFARNSKNVVIFNEYLYLFLQSSIIVHYRVEIFITGT